MKYDIQIFETPDDVAVAFAGWFEEQVNQSDGAFNVSLSGGSTPRRLFQLWATRFRNSTEWSKVRFFWGDERCVPPDDAESNFGVANELFFAPCGISADQIFRVRGEDDPAGEAKRYAELLNGNLPVSDSLPVFSLVILGMGGDGHTASIFPHQMELLTSPDCCGVAVNPDSGQQRITLTGRVINAAAAVVALVTGSGKTDVLAEVLSGEGEAYPISHITPASGLKFYVDRAAAGDLE